MFSFHTLVTCIVALSLIFTVTIIFFERKNPASTIAWVLILNIIPVIGVIAYLFLGSGFHINQRKRYALKATADSLYSDYILSQLTLENTTLPNKNSPQTYRMQQYLSEDGQNLCTMNNAADVFLDGVKLFSKMKEDLLAATDHIHLLYYIFRNDTLGKEIIAILTDKAKQGVAVRVIYDSVGSLLASDSMFTALKKAGGHVVAFSPVFSNFSSQLRLNYRNHRKISVIDGTIGYVGGMNIGTEYMGADKRLSPWRDTHMRITGSAVWTLQKRFLMDWGFTSDENIHQLTTQRLFPPATQPGKLAMHIVSSGPDTTENQIKGGLLEMIYAAQDTLYLQTPYFIPDENMLEALCIAANAGVDVRLMIPGISDHWFVSKATLGYAQQALKAGIKVYCYNGFLHAKTIVCDTDIVTIGSTNISNRSFSLNFEINAFIYDKEFASQQQQVFINDLRHCTELTSAWFNNQTLLTHGLYNFSRLFAPLM